MGGCGKIRVFSEDFEQDVLERLFTRIDPEQLRDQQPADDETAKVMSELARLDGVKTQLAELAGTGELDLAEFSSSEGDQRVGDAGPTGNNRPVGRGRSYASGTG